MERMTENDDDMPGDDLDDMLDDSDSDPTRRPQRA